MALLTFKVNMDMRHTRSPHADTDAAIRALYRSLIISNFEEPALGGALVAEDGTRIGSYVVEFANGD